MSDYSPGPGWWQASDGKWYPPEQHPSYQPPTPAAKPSSRRGFLIAGAVAVVAIVGAVAFAMGGGDDDEKASSTDDKSEQSDESDRTDGTDESDSTNATEPHPVSGGTVEDPTLGYALTFPENWVAAPLSPGSDAADLGDQLFPDDPARASAFEQFASVIPRGVSLVAVDADDDSSPTGIGTNLNVLSIPGRVSLDDIEDQLPPGIEAFGGDVVDVSRFDTGEGESVRAEYTLTIGGQKLYGVQFGVVLDGTPIAFTFSGLDSDRYAEFDSIMKTLAITR